MAGITNIAQHIRKPNRLRETSVLAIVLSGLSAPAAAGTFSNTDQGALGNPGQVCNNALVRTITVTDVGQITDIDMGLLISHQDRGDVAAAIRHPDGTQVLVLNVNGTTLNNYNVRFDDAAGNTVNTAPHNTNDNGTSAPPYENVVRPSNPLSVFNGKSPTGNWLFLACDNVANGVDGLFRRTDLFITVAEAIDLSLNLSSTSSGDPGSTAVIRVDITNATGTNTATGVEFGLDLGSGLTYQSVSGATFDPVTGRFSVADLTAGQTRSVDVTVLVGPSGDYSLTGEILAADQVDLDSTPDNDDPGEDDQDFLIFTQQTTPGNPPVLQCALGAPVNRLEWDPPGGAFAWNAGDLTNSYTVNGIPIQVTISGDTNRLIPRNLNGVSTPTPVSGDEFNGGGIFDNGVIVHLDFEDYAESITITFDYGEADVGAGGVQIPIADLDLGSWTDRVEAVGSLNGQPVTPVYTANTANTVTNGGISGTAGSSSTQGNGNAWVTFPQSVDTVSLTYSNVSTNGGNPTSQVLSFEALEYCDPEEADVSAVKTVEAADPNGYLIPGETVIYRITATNGTNANIAAEDLVIRDTLPETVRFASASSTGFTGGSFTNPALPAANTDCATTNACNINFEGATLPIGVTGEIIIEAVVK